MTVFVQVPKDVLFQEVGGEAILLNLENGKYYGLDEVGTRMWTLLAEHGNPEPVVSAMLKEFDVEEAQLSVDLHGLIAKLAENGLLHVTEA